MRYEHARLITTLEIIATPAELDLNIDLSQRHNATPQRTPNSAASTPPNTIQSTLCTSTRYNRRWQASLVSLRRRFRVLGRANDQ